jgi:tRNA(fMet)-specific endonuclease VapC
VIAVERGQLKLRDHVNAADEVVIAAITAAELLHGAHGSDDNRRAARLAHVESFLSSIPIIDYDLEVAREHGRLLDLMRRAGRRRGSHDLMIAATAAARGLTILTRDTKGFSDLPGIDVRIV